MALVVVEVDVALSRQFVAVVARFTGEVDGVAGQACVDEGVVARAVQQGVVAFAAFEVVVAAGAVEPVVARAAQEGVVAVGVADEDVVVGAAFDEVVAAFAEDNEVEVGKRTTHDLVRGVAAKPDDFAREPHNLLHIGRPMVRKAWISAPRPANQNRAGCVAHCARRGTQKTPAARQGFDGEFTDARMGCAGFGLRASGFGLRASGFGQKYGTSCAPLR